MALFFGLLVPESLDLLLLKNMTLFGTCHFLCGFRASGCFTETIYKNAPKRGLSSFCTCTIFLLLLLAHRFLGTPTGKLHELTLIFLLPQVHLYLLCHPSLEVLAFDRTCLDSHKNGSLDPLSSINKTHSR